MGLPVLKNVFKNQTTRNSFLTVGNDDLRIWCNYNHHCYGNGGWGEGGGLLDREKLVLQLGCEMCSLTEIEGTDIAQRDDTALNHMLK